ncbi:early endosome antigen 1-like [Palaemon carinicauda]|uniref:early endosome antigen 1-like n=1 Tax=Palaemon carinicauda TaxID=392227 RepID=UPI0035B5A6E8
MRKFWAEEEKSEELEPVLDQEELDGVSEETEAVISRKDPSLSGEEEQLLLPGGAGSVISNRDVQVQVHPGLLTSNRDTDVQVQTEHLIYNREVEVQVEPAPISNTDVTVQTDGDTEIEDLRRKNETIANELANKQAVIEAHENQLVDYYQSIQELKAELKMARKKNDIQNQMESALVREKKALKQELEDKMTLDEENTVKIVQLNEELEKAKKEIKAHDELKSILLAENEVLKISNKERSFLNKELALEKIKLEKELMEARVNDQKRSQEHQRLVEELQGEISKALVQNHELKEAVFTVTKKNEGL